jgi:hypothetical protein
MPRKSKSTPKKRRGSRRQNQHQNHNEQGPDDQSLHFNQSGGNAPEMSQGQNQGKIEISQATLNQAGQIAQKFLESDGW